MGHLVQPVGRCSRTYVLILREDAGGVKGPHGIEIMVTEISGLPEKYGYRSGRRQRWTGRVPIHRDEYAKRQRERYMGAGKLEKGSFRDEVVAVTGYHRKAAVRLLRGGRRMAGGGGRGAGRPALEFIVHLLNEFLSGVSIPIGTESKVKDSR